MKQVFTVALLLFAVGLCSLPARAVDSSACPIEQVVGQVQQIVGDQQDVHVLRAGRAVPVTPKMCLLYGDHIEAGLQATVTIDTTTGPHHVGGDFDPAWDIPQAQEIASPDLSAALTELFRGVMSQTRHQSSYATSRGAAPCPGSTGSPQPLAALDRLGNADQRIGADLRGLAAAWKPSPEVRNVQVRLLDSGGRIVVGGHFCFGAHAILPLPAGVFHLGDHFVLHIVDDGGDTLSYHLLVVDPAQLPRPPHTLHEGWATAAWRLAAGPPDTRLDAISRLEFGPPDALAVRRILVAVWTDEPF